MTSHQAFKSLVPSLLIRSIDETLEFYARLGFHPVAWYPDQDDPSWIEVERDGIHLQFYTRPPQDTPTDPVLSGTLYFVVDGVLSMARTLAPRVELSWGPEIMDYGMREFGVRDPNGYYLAFTEPVEPEVNSARAR